jgi:hypothetical protein
MYEHHLPAAVKAIAPVCRTEAVALLADLLDQAVHIGGKVKVDPPHDYTHYLSLPVSDDGIKHDVTEAVVGEIVRASKLALEADPACTRDVVLRIRSHAPKIFTRIALHVLSLNPGGAPDLSQASLADHDLIEETWCRVEYGDLVRAWFPSLPAPVQEEMLAYIDSVPDKYRDRFNARFGQHEKRPPTAAEQRIRDESLMRDLVWHWREVLPADRRERVEKLGDPDAWRQRLYEAENSPLSAPDFSTRPIDEVVTFLETWRPSTTREQRETATALAQELREAAMANAALYSANAARFAQLAPIYVRRLLEGLSNSSSNKNDLEWSGTLTLIEAIVRPDVQRLPTGIEGDDPDWGWARKVAIEVLASGLRRGAEGIPFAHANRVQALILELHRAAPRQPDTEDFEESYRSFPHFGAQATSRGATVELCVLLIFWLSKDPTSEAGKFPRETLEKLPDIRRVFETELADRTSAGRIPRAILGRYLNWFYFFAEPWLVQQFPALFPNDSVPLRDAAWRAHLSADSGPNSALAPQMRDCYVAEIARLGADSAERDRQHVDDRLAEYLVILYISAAFPDEIFEQFWNTAPPGPRQHAVWFLSVQLELPPDKLPDNLRARAISYWERRLAAATSSATPDAFRQELGALGQLFFRKGIPSEWLMDQALAMCAAGFAPGEPCSVVDRLVQLSPNFPDRAAEVLAALAKNRQFDRWVYMGQSAGIRTIMTNGLATGAPATAAAIAEAINYLAAMGDTGYIDLLPNPPLK